MDLKNCHTETKSTSKLKTCLPLFIIWLNPGARWSKFYMFWLATNLPAWDSHVDFARKSSLFEQNVFKILYWSSFFGQDGCILALFSQSIICKKRTWPICSYLDLLLGQHKCICTCMVPVVRPWLVPWQFLNMKGYMFILTSRLYSCGHPLIGIFLYSYYSGTQPYGHLGNMVTSL